MSNTNKEEMTRKQKKKLIVESLEFLAPDVLDMIYRIVLHAESGLE